MKRILAILFFVVGSAALWVTKNDKAYNYVATGVEKLGYQITFYPLKYMAEQGDASSQTELGLRYTFARGVAMK